MATLEALGKYTLRGTLGRGAMGTVYDGWDPAIDRRVAIKTVALANSDDEETAEALARFKREAQAAGRLSHPNIVGVYDYGETADLAYIVMEFVEGRSLKSLLDQERRLPPPEAGTIMQQVLAGLGYSHARGVVHRDIKPANVMLTSEGQVKIADFGIARIESSSMTSVGTVMGTPAYMPPEQFLGEAVDARSDIYAAGVMLYHLLTGERPYEGSMTAIMHRVLNTDPPPLASAKGVPAAFDAVIAGAIAKAPADRYPSAGAFAAALCRALAAAGREPEEDATVVSRSATARPASPALAPDAKSAGRSGRTPPSATPPPAAATKSGMALALLGGVAVLLAAGGGAWFLLKPGGQTQAAATPEHGQPPAAQPPPPPAETAAVASPPAVTARPAEPPPAKPQPTPEERLAALRTMLPGRACSKLAATAGADGRIVVDGLIGEAQAASARAAAEGLAGPGLGWTALPIPDLYCPALDLARSPTSAGVSLTVNGAARLVALRDEGKILPKVVLPGEGYVLVDYLSHDGTMGHMLPLPGKLPRLHGGTVTPPPGLVGPPFGRDVVVATVSSRPLFTVPRSDSDKVGPYLDALAAAVTAAQAAGVTVSVGVTVVDTLAKE